MARFVSTHAQADSFSRKLCYLPTLRENLRSVLFCGTPWRKLKAKLSAVCFERKTAANLALFDATALQIYRVSEVCEYASVEQQRLCRRNAETLWNQAQWDAEQ